MNDTIDRDAVINMIMETDPFWSVGMTRTIYEGIKRMPSAQPEHLTDDDFETIRIHLSAFKEKLCNQGRYREAEEYQRLIDRFMAFASAYSDVPAINAVDTISRQAAIDEIKQFYRKHDNDLLELLVYKLEQLPSAQPKTAK